MQPDQRQYPLLPREGDLPRRPISFVVVRFSQEYYYNILESRAVKASINELITVDNTGNLYFDNLSEAIAVGLSKARHSLRVVVHEDVLLPDGWQAAFEKNLQLLEREDPHWGLLGAVGWTEDEEIIGHWSDPGPLYMNTFDSRPFRPVFRLDEQLLVFHRDRRIPLDPDLPSVHHLGRDLAIQARRRGWKVYAIDAPTIHKYADESNRIIATEPDSRKHVERTSKRFHADYTFSTDYLLEKWPGLKVVNQHYSPCQLLPCEELDSLGDSLDEPIILLGRGGGGSRLLSLLCLDLGVFLGNHLNESGDSLELAIPIFLAIMAKYRGRKPWQEERIIPILRSSTARMLLEAQLPPETLWGFKLPESLLILPELAGAFPKARFLHLVRDPVNTCLRRTHLTARLDNCIGRLSLPLAYQHARRPREDILTESSAEHMAYTTLHQLEEVAKHRLATEPDRFTQIRFEDLVARPTECLERVQAILGLDRMAHELEAVIDPQRARGRPEMIPPTIRSKVHAILRPVRIAYGYPSE